MDNTLPPEYWDYDKELSRTLVQFQYIEEAIRLCLTNCYDIARHKIEGEIPFHFDYEYVERDPLGTLIKKFEYFCDDEILINDLKYLVQHRNGATHKGWLMNKDMQRNPEYLIQKTSEIKDICGKASKAFEVLTKMFGELKNTNDNFHNKSLVRDV